MQQNPDELIFSALMLQYPDIKDALFTAEEPVTGIKNDGTCILLTEQALTQEKFNQGLQQILTAPEQQQAYINNKPVRITHRHGKYGSGYTYTLTFAAPGTTSRTIIVSRIKPL